MEPSIDANATRVWSGRLLTPADTAQRLGVTEQTLTNWRWKRRRGPDWVKVSGQVGQAGGRVGYPEDAVAAYLAARSVNGAPTTDGPALDSAALERL